MCVCVLIGSSVFNASVTTNLTLLTIDPTKPNDHPVLKVKYLKMRARLGLM